MRSEFSVGAKREYPTPFISLPKCGVPRKERRLMLKSCQQTTTKNGVRFLITWVLKSISMIVQLTISPFKSLNFCLTYFEVLFLGT